MSGLTRASPPRFTEYPTVLPNWDNTPRSGLNGLVLHGSTPELFKTVLRRGVNLVQGYPAETAHRLHQGVERVGRGQLSSEPDQRFGHGYLRAVREVLQETR